MANPIGTCSLCGGPVSIPNMTTRPIARCEDCGALAVNAHGPVIPMQQPGNVTRVNYACTCGTTAGCQLHGSNQWKL